MGRIYKVHEAQADLLHMLDQVAAGEEIIIARQGRLLARIVPIPTGRQPGRLKGCINLGDDFNAPLPPETIARFLNAE